MTDTLRVRMIPDLDGIGTQPSGISTVVKAYFKHLPDHGIRFTYGDDFDVLAVHAGMTRSFPIDAPLVSILHGLYWTADYDADMWEWAANRDVIESIRRATKVTVPSSWVSEAIKRDMRISPTVVGHGIDWIEWQHTQSDGGYVLAFAKNRAADVCDPSFVVPLAKAFPNLTFVCTLVPPGNLSPNIIPIGVIPHEQMKIVIQRASLVMSPIKETFGMLTLEAMASGKPILGVRHGANTDLVSHGVNGYLAAPHNNDDLCSGLDWCLKHKDTLGANSREIAKEWTWEKACEKLANVFRSAVEESPATTSNTVGVVIPCYMYGDEKRLGRALDSVINQTVVADQIVVVDDGSPDDGATRDLVAKIANQYPDANIQYVRQDNSGVAVARNNGIAHLNTTFVCCLDADDAMDTEFIRACKESLVSDPRIGIAYTKILAIPPNGGARTSEWPGEYNYDKQLARHNQIPTLCMFRREAWKRTGGYKSRYCPTGAGSEDAELWTRMGAIGYGGKLVTEAPLFIYTLSQGHTSKKGYREIDWLELHPYAKDGIHPFASMATPKKISHPVHQYDEPTISVVIPVGSNHKRDVFYALDSLESQTERRWEAIVVDDSGSDGGWDMDGNPNGLEAYPYVRLVKTSGKCGAGAARNAGAAIARAPFLLFLDADDWLDPLCLQTMLEAWEQAGDSIIYTDYIGKAIIDDAEASRLQRAGRLLHFNPNNNMAVIRHYAADYDCERAIAQPANPLYIWCLITSMLPTAWHKEIGGFDESMSSWEDWDYWVRLAMAGKCFVRVPQPLVIYRYYSGERREIGGKNHQSLLQYLVAKYTKAQEKIKMCNCKGNKNVNLPARTANERMLAGAQNMASNMSDSDVILCTYNPPGLGEHRVVGSATRTDYGYRGAGEQLLVNIADIKANPGLFVPVPEKPAANVVPEASSLPPAPEPVETVTVETAVVASTAESTVEGTLVPSSSPSPVSKITADALAFLKSPDLGALPGMTPGIKAELETRGVIDTQGLLDMGEALETVPGMSIRRANALRKAATSAMELAKANTKPDAEDMLPSLSQEETDK